MLGQLVGAQRVEEHDVVEPVEELRLERRPDRRHAPPRACASSPSIGSTRNCEPRLEVSTRIVLRKSTVRPWPSVSRPSSSTCSRMSKTSGWAFSTSSSSTTEYGPAAHRLGQLAALLVADVAGRAHRPAAPRECFSRVLAHVDPDHRPLVVEQEVGERLGQLGLADAGGAEEQERAGRPVGVGDAGPGAAYGVADRPHGRRLADQPARRGSPPSAAASRSRPRAAGRPGCRSRRRRRRRCRPGRPPP